MPTFQLSRPRRLSRWLIASSLAALIATPTAASARDFGEWGTAVAETALNSAQADGCPIESFDGLSLYMASTRPGAVGGDTDPNDIWVAFAARLTRHGSPRCICPRR